MTATRSLSYTLRDGIGVITIRTLAEALAAGLSDLIARDQANEAVEGLVLVLAGSNDADMSAQLNGLSDLSRQIEDSPKPVVALWQGVVRDELCELGLAAHARIMIADARIGLTSVKRGLVPSAGGTQRLPRLVGLSTALDVLLSGRMVLAKEAHASGLVNGLATDDGIADAMAMVRFLKGSVLPKTSTLVRSEDVTVLDAASAPLLRRLRGQDAPQEIIRLLRISVSEEFAIGIAEEKAAAICLAQGPQAAALTYVREAERDLAQRSQLQSQSARLVQKVGIIGAGTMGAGIAVAFLDAGYDVTLIETDDAGLMRGVQRIEVIYERLVANGRLNEPQRQERRARLTPHTDLTALQSADLVLEAIFEDMAVKTALLAQLDTIIQPSCILATNTSYLNINDMAEGLADPSRLVGMHFFSPAHIMPMLEVVRADNTAPDVVATALSLGRRLGKTAIVAGVCDGFIGNRIFSKYRMLCEFMLEEGALPFEIDEALEAYGFAMGPFAQSDLAGLDISWARRKALAPTRRPDQRYVPIADHICEMGRFGQKTGSGWYRYDQGRRMRDPEIEALVRAHAAKAGYPQKQWTADEIVANVLAVMANEGAQILADDIAAQASDIDLVLLKGYGFPTFRGGPMFAGEGLGWKRVVQLMQSIAERGGSLFQVADLARQLATDHGRLFADAPH